MNDLQQHGSNGHEHPEILALRALGFIAARPPALKRFLAETRLRRTDLMRQPTNRDYRVAALQFLAHHGLLLLNFSQIAAQLPDAVYATSREIMPIAQTRREARHRSRRLTRKRSPGA